MEHFDIAVVGARVAGAAVAVHLARAGFSVLVLERAVFPSETPSTHTVQEMSALGDLGVLGQLHEAGAPVIMRSSLWIDGMDLSAPHVSLPRMSVRRITLDAILADAAHRAGADVRMGRKVLGIGRHRDRVCAVYYQGPDGSPRTATCSLVVGADGRSSTVARLVGARRYDVTYNERGAVWRYYTDMPSPAEFYFCRRERQLLLAAPCDNGRTMLAVQPSLAETSAYRAPGMVEQSFLEHAAPWGAGEASWDKLLAAAVPDGEARMILRYPCFFRESAGPGWVLIGDAGHVKDVVTGQGISDALRQAENVAERIQASWGSDRALDRALRGWWLSRDRQARPMYWLSQDMGRAGTVPLVHREFFRRISASPGLRDQLQKTLSRKQSPNRLNSSLRFLAVSHGLLTDPRLRGTGVLSAICSTGRVELARRLQLMMPRPGRPLAQFAQEGA